MIVRALIVCIVLLPALASGQYLSDGGKFSLDEVKGCAPLTINITPIESCPCNMEFGDGTAIANMLTYTYTTPGTYKLRILFPAQPSNPFDEITITVLPNTPPTFEAYACTANAVSVKVTDNIYDQYFIDFNDGNTALVPSGSLATATNTYATSGTKAITVTGRYLNAADNCNNATQMIDARASLGAATIDRLTVLNDKQVQLDFAPEANVRYRLEIAQNNATTFQLVQHVFGINNITISNLQTDQLYYCFRLATVDPCNGAPPVYSNTICSANFDLAVQDNVNALAWTTSAAGVSQHNIVRNTQSFVSVAAAQVSYNDADIECKSDYCYQLVTQYANGSESISLEKCGTAFSKTIPTTVQDITASVTASGAELTWAQDPAFTATEYSVRRGSNASFSLLGTTATPAFSDNTYTTEGAYCYKVNYKDKCDNISLLSAEACPVRLGGAVSNDNVINLSWSPYSGWQNGVSGYMVDKYDGQGTLLQTFDVGIGTSLADDAGDPANQVYVYVVRAIPNDAGLAEAFSNTLRLVKKPNIFHPNAFTPNDDGLNDTFLVFGQYILDFEMKIFNRWGELMYTTTTLEQGWDGSFKGQQMPEGTYVFVANITDLSGRNFERSGSFMLLRKGR